MSGAHHSDDVSFVRAGGREMCGLGVVAGTEGVRDMFGVKGGPVSETKVDYHHQKKNFTYFHYFITLLSPPFDHYRDNKAGHAKKNSCSVLKWTLSNRQLSHGPYGRHPFDQNFRKFWSKTQWIGSIQPE